MIEILIAFVISVLFSAGAGYIVGAAVSDSQYQMGYSDGWDALEKLQQQNTIDATFEKVDEHV